MNGNVQTLRTNKPKMKRLRVQLPQQMKRLNKPTSKVRNKMQKSKVTQRILLLSIAAVLCACQSQPVAQAPLSVGLKQIPPRLLVKQEPNYLIRLSNFLSVKPSEPTKP